MDQDAQSRRNDGCKGLNSNEACRETHTLEAERKPSGMENRKAEEKYREGRDGRRRAKESFRASGRGDVGTKGRQEKGSNSVLQEK